MTQLLEQNNCSRTFSTQLVRKSLFLLFLTFLAACQTVSETSQSKPKVYIYLAGPEVFLPDPIGAGKSKKAKIEQLNRENDWPFELVGLYPMDNEIADFAPDKKTGLAIYFANIKLMEQADYITANMVRFRGPSMDVGTAFEMGYMRGAKKPVFAYYDAKPFYGADETPGMYNERVRKFYPMSEDNPEVDADGQSVENFQMEDNLMMVGALESGAANIAPSFTDAVLQIADHLLKKQSLKR